MFQIPNDHRNIMMKYDGEILKIRDVKDVPRQWNGEIWSSIQPKNVGDYSFSSRVPSKTNFSTKRPSPKWEKFTVLDFCDRCCFFCGFYHRLKVHPKSKDSLPFLPDPNSSLQKLGPNPKWKDALPATIFPWVSAVSFWGVYVVFLFLCLRCQSE